ncbi:MAG: polysaccharide biosynthesis tyrosine autokinase [Microcoleus vaginatus WJT46-NPBG5]|jgi:capsular exopolysaccharide synthesis family protein|nr:polysaccharide biosynthesis tyrosine autokinase [Microcoleus vaginatus WJT46-NPBG5]
MDTEHEFKAFSAKSKSKPHQFPPQFDAEGSEGGATEKLDLFWVFAVVRRRFLVMTGVAIALSAAAGTLIVSSSRQIVLQYEGSFKLLVEAPTAEDRLAKQFLLAQNGNSESLDKRTEESSFLDYETQIRVLRSPKIMMPVIEKLQKQYPKITYSSLIADLVITRSTFLKDGKQQGTKILAVEYTDSDPKKVLYVLENLAKEYLDYSLQQRLISINQGIQFIESKLPSQQERVDRLQAQMQQLRVSSNLLDPALEGRSLTEQGQSIQNDRVDIRTQLDSQRASYENLQRQLDESDGLAIIMTEPKAYETLLGQLQKVNTELAMKRARYREDSAPVRALREKQQQLMALVNQEAKNVIMAKVEMSIRDLEARDQSLAESEQRLDVRITDYAANTRQYVALQSELEVVTKSLQQLLSKLEALRIDAAQKQEPWVLIDPPKIPKTATGLLMPATIKETKKQLVLAIILCSLLGIVVGFLVEVLNTVFHTPEEAKAATKLPLLGVIPFAKSLQKSAAVPTPAGLGKGAGGLSLMLGNAATAQQQYMASPVLEAFRTLYTNIRLLSPHTPIRSFAIGSAASGDGKSTVAIHLAQAAAAIGQRVLLVDADLRSPKIHTKLGLSNERGLSDAIATDIGLNDVIQRSQNTGSDEASWWEDNLFVLSAGSLAPDPIKLLSSKKMLYLMEQFQAFFDLVIYDTPPLIGLADGNILAAHTDGIVMVVGLDKTDRSLLNKSLDGLKISGASILGIVANGVKG